MSKFVKNKFEITGAKDIANRILMEKNRILKDTAEAVEKGAVDVSNSAKADHERGIGHGMGRFETVTGTLGKSITPALESVGFDKITSVVFTNVVYAWPVEMRFPYLFPALISNQAKFVERMKALKR